MKKTNTHLTYEQRCQIYALKKRGIIQKEIAKEMKVNQSTIARELKRNSGKRGYRYKQAHKKACYRRFNALHNRPKKIEGWLKKYITEKLKLQWSPEQISGHLAQKKIFT